MLIDRNGKYNVYQITTKSQLDVKKIIILILMIIVIIGLIMIAGNSMEIVTRNKVYKQYEAQLIALKKQEEDRKAEIERERERIRQEKIPKLTEKRKGKYGKYLSLRNQESFFDL